VAIETFIFKSKREIYISSMRNCKIEFMGKEYEQLQDRIHGKGVGNKINKTVEMKKYVIFLISGMFMVDSLKLRYIPS